MRTILATFSGALLLVASSSPLFVILQVHKQYTALAFGPSLANNLPHRHTSSQGQPSPTSLFAVKHNNNDEKTRYRKRDLILDTLTGRKTKTRRKEKGAAASAATRIIRNITTIEELEEHWSGVNFHRRSNNNKKQKKEDSIDYQALIEAASVIGDTQIIGSPDHTNYTHPVVKLIHERRHKLEQNNNNSNSIAATGDDLLFAEDNCKVALSVEGGGMRGCVSAGMICAIHHLNLTDTIDVIYGSSAGSIISAYLITGQLPWFGPELYYDRLTTAGRKFIDTRRLLRAVGLGLLDPRLLKDVVTSRSGKPVLNLHYLLKTTVQETKPLDWDKFVQRQAVQPLNVVTSGLKSERAVVLNMANGGFDSLEELTDAMHASCLLPGIAGPVMNLDTRTLGDKNKTALFGIAKTKNSSSSSSSKINGEKDDSNESSKYVLGNNLKGDYEPLADALIYEPLPFRTAVERDNATHCIVIRSRPDGVDVTGKPSVFEKLISKRFFQRKNNLPHLYQRMRQHLHKKLYARDVIVLNQAAYSTRHYKDTTTGEPHLMAIAVPPGSPEVTRLEVGREAIFSGLRRGFARAYDCLVEDPAERGRGAEVAQQFFPDEILDYNPLDIDSTDESAFAAYMEQHGISPKSWAEADKKTASSSSMLEEAKLLL